MSGDLFESYFDRSLFYVSVFRPSLHREGVRRTHRLAELVPGRKEAFRDGANLSRIPRLTALAGLDQAH